MPASDLQELLSRFAVALGIGLLIGLERGWRTREMQSGSRTAGVRTFAVSGLLGAVAAALSQASGIGAGFVLGASFAAFAAVMIVFCREENKASGKFSATTAIAAILTFSLGAFALMGDMRVAAAAAVATAGILASREDIHSWVAKITGPELRSALVLLAMTFIVLPVVPDDPIGPFGGVNPREIWLIAIVLAAVSFLGYLGVRMLGTKRGILVASAAGGLASSTAVTVANARHSAAGEVDPALLAGGVALASAGLIPARDGDCCGASLGIAAIRCAPTDYRDRRCRRAEPVAVAMANGTQQQGYPTRRLSQSLCFLVGRRLRYFPRHHCCRRPRDQRARGRSRCDPRRRGDGNCGRRRDHRFNRQPWLAGSVRSERSTRCLVGGGDEYIEQAGHRCGHRKRALRPLPGHRVNGMRRSCRNCTLADARFPATIERN
jgi:MgtC family/Domain of unknown function (DUF4010)